MEEGSSNQSGRTDSFRGQTGKLLLLSDLPDLFAQTVFSPDYSNSFVNLGSQRVKAPLSLPPGG